MRDGDDPGSFPIGSNAQLAPITAQPSASVQPRSRPGTRRPDASFGDLRAMIVLSGLVQPASRYGLEIQSITDLAAIVRRQRANLGWSQSYLASRAGVGRRFVSELERGKLTVRLDETLKVLIACELKLTSHRERK